MSTADFAAAAAPRWLCSILLCDVMSPWQPVFVRVKAGIIDYIGQYLSRQTIPSKVNRGQYSLLLCSIGTLALYSCKFFEIYAKFLLEYAHVGQHARCLCSGRLPTLAWCRLRVVKSRFSVLMFVSWEFCASFGARPPKPKLQPHMQKCMRFTSSQGPSFFPAQPCGLCNVGNKGGFLQLFLRHTQPSFGAVHRAPMLDSGQESRMQSILSMKVSCQPTVGSVPVLWRCLCRH